uniref:Uncharacterized protein n=1 Tax=Pyxicephalus adspersus TaxID=30357 RepID=A0AAV3A414_PYXAD|nr:TPA: hypothetical protein GDO54_002345 [Pyxicephalus adspersus]
MVVGRLGVPGRDFCLSCRTITFFNKLLEHHWFFVWISPGLGWCCGRLYVHIPFLLFRDIGQNLPDHVLRLQLPNVLIQSLSSFITPVGKFFVHCWPFTRS